MALIKCKECGNEISTKAAACPKCGAVQPKRTSTFTWIIAIILVVGTIQTMIMVATRKDDVTAPPPSVARSAPVTSAPAAGSCDRSIALKAQEGLREFAQISEQSGRVTYTWGPVWDNQTDERRLRFIRAAADADACLTGAAREIRFYSNGRLVGVASPTSGIQLTR